MSPRTVFSPYARLFTVPGSAAFSFAGWVGRLPAPMLGLGAVFLVEGETGSYGLAGAVSGTLALSFGVAGPLWARAMDRRGQGRVLRLAMTAFLVSGIGFVTAVVAGGPLWSWFLLAAAAGATGPNIGSMVRARWSAVLDPAGRQTAFAFEAVVDEVVFVVGPPLVTLLATLIAPPVGFLTGRVHRRDRRVLAGRRSGATEPPVHPVDAAAPARRLAVLTPTLLVVVVTYLAVGTLFGAIDVVVVGFAEAEGAPAVSGLALAVFAAGSLVAGLAYGLARLPGTLAARFVGTAVAFGLAGQLLWGVGLAAGADRLRLPRRAHDRAGAGVRHLAGRVPGRARRAHRVAGLDDHRPDARRHRRLGAWRARPWTRGERRPPSPSRPWPPGSPRCSRWRGRRCCAVRSGRRHSAGRKPRAWSVRRRGSGSSRQAAPRRAAPPRSEGRPLWPLPPPPECPRSP